MHEKRGGVLSLHENRGGVLSLHEKIKEAGWWDRADRNQGTWLQEPCFTEHLIVVAGFFTDIFHLLLHSVYKIICEALGHSYARNSDSSLSQEASFGCSVSIMRKGGNKVRCYVWYFKIPIVLWFWHSFCLVWTLALLPWFKIFACLQLTFDIFLHLIYMFVYLFCLFVSHSSPYFCL